MIDFRSGVRLAPIVLALLAVGCGKEVTTGYQGYVEGEYLYLAAPQAGYLKSLEAARGSRGRAGQACFAVASDPDDLDFSVVFNDLPDNVVALGNPARPMRPNLEQRVFKCTEAA